MSVSAADPPPDAALPLGGWRPEALAAALVARGLRPGQARLAVQALATGWHRLGRPYADLVAEAPRAVRWLLPELVADEPVLDCVQDVRAADGTRRLLFRLHDGAVVESVLIPASGASPRTTLCVSSQVGCARRCAFCETGRLGLLRNLSAAEITAQARTARRLWDADCGQAPPLSNVVFMGMGEPFDNLGAVADACAILTHDHAHGFSWRRITVSTVGVVAKIPTFFQTVRANLAVSLNAPDDVRRSQVMPINDRSDMATLKAALQACLPPGRDVLIEYVLFDGWNDAMADADLLRAWLDGLPVRLNLIPANPGPDPKLRTPTREAVVAFQKHLLQQGVRAMVRWPHGREVGGACGQLAGAQRAAAAQR